jgi:hypothetical protein
MQTYNLGEQHENFNPKSLTIDLCRDDANAIHCLVASGDSLTVEFQHAGVNYSGLYEFFIDAPTYCDCCGPEFNSACLTRITD